MLKVLKQVKTDIDLSTRSWNLFYGPTIVYIRPLSIHFSFVIFLQFFRFRQIRYQKIPARKYVL